MKCRSAPIAFSASRKWAITLSIILALRASIGFASDTNKLVMKARGPVPASIELITTNATRETVLFVPIAVATAVSNTLEALPPQAIELTTSGATSQTVRYVPASALSATATNREPDQPPHPESPALAREQLLQQRIDMLEQRLTAFAAPREPTVSPADHEELRGEVRNLRSTVSQLVPIAPPTLPTHRLSAESEQESYLRCSHCGAALRVIIRHP